MKKVVKFGGSSLASAEQFRKVRSIIKADPERRFVVPSAPGKRSKDDEKVTDMLYACYALAEEGSDFSEKLSAIRAQGYAVEDGEYKIGLRSVSAPIYASDGQMRYALSLVGMFRRVSSREFLQATQDAVAAAAQISAALGFSGTQKPLDKSHLR